MPAVGPRVNGVFGVSGIVCVLDGSQLVISSPPSTQCQPIENGFDLRLRMSRRLPTESDRLHSFGDRFFIGQSLCLDSSVEQGPVQPPMNRVGLWSGRDEGWILVSGWVGVGPPLQMRA